MSVMPEPGRPGGPLAPPIFGRSVNPIRTGEGRLSPPITTGPLNIFHLPASLKFDLSLSQMTLFAILKNSFSSWLDPNVSIQVDKS